MYSPSSPALSSYDGLLVDYQSTQCLKFKYFSTFIISTTCIAILCAALATQSWLVAKPIRVVKINGRPTNLSFLYIHDNQVRHQQQHSHLLNSTSNQFDDTELQNQKHHQLTSYQDNKFHGEISFGLFSGIKILNYGFGDRISQISVIQSLFSRDLSHELVSFRFWISTLIGVLLALIFCLISDILTLVNYFVTPESTLAGPIGLIICNSISSCACLSSIFSWFAEYYSRLRFNVLTNEEVLNGWSSDNRSSLGFSYYLLVIAFFLKLLNICIVLLVQFKSSSQKRKARAVCEGVIMLY